MQPPLSDFVRPGDQSMEPNSMLEILVNRVAMDGVIPGNGLTLIR